VVRLLRAARPAAFVLENVPHLEQAQGGLALRAVVAALQRSGYRVAWRVLDGGALLAQARRRLFLVGARDGRPFAWPAMNQLGLAWRDIADSEAEAAQRAELRLAPNQLAAMRNVPVVSPDKKVCPCPFGSSSDAH
jgi:site-specific DNA-cytosine methylase